MTGPSTLSNHRRPPRQQGTSAIMGMLQQQQGMVVQEKHKTRGTIIQTGAAGNGARFYSNF